MKHHKVIAWQKNGDIGVLSIDNPPGNLLEEPEFMDKKWLEGRLEDLSLKGLLIKGTGRHFSAGADMKNLKKLAEDEAFMIKKMAGGKDLIRFIEQIDIPVVASITGICFGAGLEIALACDIRICSENTLFAFPETNYGIMPGMGGTVMLSKLVGPGKAAEIILSGDTFDASRALKLKLADYVVPANEIHEYSLNYLKKLISGRNIEVIRSVMRSLHNAQTLSFEKALEEETKLFCSLAVKSMQNGED
jgi:enoyl-CoA hydratase/carnithine racemase